MAPSISLILSTLPDGGMTDLANSKDANRKRRRRDTERNELFHDSTLQSQAKTMLEKEAAPQTTSAGSEPQRYEFDDGKARKFWMIELSGKSHTVTYGRLGTDGQIRTKEFDSEEAAAKSRDKLVAEKTKKGYAAVSADVKPAPAPVAAQPDTPESPTRQEGVAREIDLPLGDRLRAGLGNGSDKRPAPAAFDLDACVKQAANIRTENYGWEWHYAGVEFPTTLSRQEAHFWFQLITHPRDSSVKPAAVARKIAKDSGNFTGELSLDQARKRLETFQRTIAPEVVAALEALFPATDLFDLILDDYDVNVPKHHPSGWAVNQLGLLRQSLACGFARYVAPWMTKKARKTAADRIRPALVPGNVPQDYYQALPPEFYLAGSLGLHDELASVVSGWADDRYAGEEWSDHYQRPQDVVFGLGSPERIAAEWRRLKLRMRSAADVRAFLALTELSALDCVRDSVLAETNRDRCAELLSAFTLVRSPEAAELMLECKRSSKAPRIAREWLDAQVGNAVAGLVATAGGRGGLADAAVQYLRDAKQQGYGKLIKSALSALNPDAAEKVQREVVDYEQKVYPAFDAKSTPKWLEKALAEAGSLKTKKQPAWATAASLPPIVLGDHQLSGEQADALLKALTSPDIPPSHPLLQGLREHADRQSLDDFAWRGFESWLEEGAPAKDKWAMRAVGLLGSDRLALKLTPLVRKWPGESQHARAVLGLECLRDIGTDTALMQLNGVAQKVKFQGLKKKAREFMESIAKDKGMTRDELEDRVVPDLDLDEHGTREFDFGPRKFQFVLSPDMKPAVKDEAGKIRKDLPKPAAKDDAEQAAAAVADWKLLKKLLREAIKIQVPRLEQAMVTGRRWTVAEFESLLARHPLMTNLVRTLLWGGYDKDGKLQGTFRVTDEQDYADVRDEPFSLAKLSGVGIVHPLNLSDEDAAAWGEIFSDYEIAAPFPQIGRETYGLEKGEEKSKEIDRFGKVKIPALSLVGTLDRLGWTRGTPLDAGVFHEHSKPFYGANVTAVVAYEEGVPIGYMDGWDDQKITGCYFLPGLAGSGWEYPNPSKGLALGKIDPVVISEVLADLHVLASKGE